MHLVGNEMKWSVVVVVVVVAVVVVVVVAVTACKSLHYT